MRDTSGSKFDRRVVVLSDVEMGAGGPTDDCPDTRFVGDLLRRTLARRGGTPIELVFNGDTFDFLKTSVDARYERHVTERIALGKLERIAAAHGDFFAALGEVLAAGPHRAHFVTGNHDYELVFPAVQAELRRLVGGTLANVRFPGFDLSLGDVHFEHGSQGDPLFRFDEDEPFVEKDGEPILNLPWGAVGLIEIALPYHEQLHFLDRVKPRDAVFEVLPEAKALLLARARDYWARGFWRSLLTERDPLKRIRWEMVKEVAYRFLSVDAEVSFGSHYTSMLAADPFHRVYVVGHEHRARSTPVEDKLLLQTGCLRHEYALHPETGIERPLPKSIAELHLVDDRAVDVRLVELDLPPGALPPPPDLSRLRAVLSELLAAPDLARYAA